MFSFETKHITTGAIAGLVGGIAFGALMGMMGMLPMVSMLIGFESAFIGLVVHAVISAITGALFGVIFGALALESKRGMAYGLLYGLVWWFLGPLIIMPLWLGMGLQLTLSGMENALPSLFGHLVWGFILGLVYAIMMRRSPQEIQKMMGVQQDTREAQHMEYAPASAQEEGTQR